MPQATLFDALIVGGGPAGVSCATWLKQLGFEPLIIEKNEQCGGRQIRVRYGYEASQKSVLGLNLVMKPNGFVWTNEDCLTSNELVYAIGELAQRAHPCCVTAKALQPRPESIRTAQFVGLSRRALQAGTKVFL